MKDIQYGVRGRQTKTDQDRERERQVERDRRGEKGKKRGRRIERATDDPIRLFFTVEGFVLVAVKLL